MRQVSRAEVMQALHEFVSGIASGEAALIFFACHGNVADQTLVLGCSDFRREIPFDSGIPLCRLFEILQKRSSNSRIVLMLSCCRAGDAPSTRDLIPSSVCVLFSCSDGETALEAAHGSLFVSGLLAACDELARHQEGGVPGCTASDLAEATMSELDRVATGTCSQLEFCGSGGGEIRVPLNVVAGSDRVADSRSSCVMVTEVMPPAIMGPFRKQAMNAITRILGLSTGVVKDNGVGKCVRALSHQRRCHVLLTGAVEHRRAWMVCEHLFDQFPSRFEEIVLEWDARLASETVRSVLKDIHDMRLSADESRFQLSWPNNDGEKRVLGVLYFDSAAKGGTIARLNCQSREGLRLPIDYLLPSLERVFKRIIVLDRKDG
jgi:hypothetical protein